MPLAAHWLRLYADEEGLKPVGFTADPRSALLAAPVSTWTCARTRAVRAAAQSWLPRASVASPSAALIAFSVSRSALRCSALLAGCCLLGHRRAVLILDGGVGDRFGVE